MRHRYQALRGTRDVLPDEVERWQFLERTTHDLFARYGFVEIRTPMMEATSLFSRSVGPSSDIVRKQMYTMRRGTESMTLRPEGTAPVVRAFVQNALHRLVAEGYPEKYYYIGPMFRHERPQKGRLRQFHQVGVEVLGGAEPLVDAETLKMVDGYLEALGVTDRELLLASVGDEHCRPRYGRALREWLEPRLEKLCTDCQRRYIENPLRVFDCNIEEDISLLADAPTLLEMLCTACEDHLGEVRRLLDGYDVPYRMDSRLVRGLDYYRRTVFEIVATGLGAQNAILGGGRYDGLVGELGGPPLPGFGFAMGMERTILLIPPERARQARRALAIVTLGREGWEAAIAMTERFRAAGVTTFMPLCERPMGAQLKRAARMRASHALFVGPDELAAGRFAFKELDSGEQVPLAVEEVLARMTAEA